MNNTQEKLKENEIASSGIYNGGKQNFETITNKAQKMNDEKNTDTYDKIFRELKGTGKLWEDPFFKETDGYEWKRPMDIDEDAVLTFKGPSRFDVKQLETTHLDRGHFLSVLASFANYQPLFENVVPDGQDFEKNYIGAFRFRFWTFGEWREVMVDDRLPTSNDKLAFVYSKRDFEFWSPLAEKAYAKLYGSYAAIRKVSKAEVMQDLTGGLCETFRLNENKRPKDLYIQMLKFEKFSSLMCCDMETMDSEIYVKEGLISLHGYSITSVVELYKNDGSTARLIRIRTPWTSNNEWKSEWSDNSKNWDTVSSDDRKIYNRKRVDGEFWMSFEDFVENFRNLVVCHLGPESVNKGFDDKIRWQMVIHDGSWVNYVNAGGTIKNHETYFTNPQYRIEVLDPDKNDKEDNVTVLFGLTQFDMRSRNLPFYAISLEIYRLTGPTSARLSKEFFKSNKPISRKTVYRNARDISFRYTLPVGHYAIVPSTYFVNQEGKFILRIASHKFNDSKEIDEEAEMVEAMYRVSNMVVDNLDKEMIFIFKRISRPTGVINALILKNILNAMMSKDTQCIKMKNFEGFTLEDTKSMVALYDYNKNAKMEFLEFVLLFKNLRLWKKVFADFDEDNNGFFNSTEYRNALCNCGFKVSNNLLNKLAVRYMDPRTGYITFEDFVVSLIQLTNFYDRLEWESKNDSGKCADYIKS